MTDYQLTNVFSSVPCDEDGLEVTVDIVDRYFKYKGVVEYDTVAETSIDWRSAKIIVTVYRPAFNRSNMTPQEVAAHEYEHVHHLQVHFRAGGMLRVACAKAFEGRIPYYERPTERAAYAAQKGSPWETRRYIRALIDMGFAEFCERYIDFKVSEGEITLLRG